MTIGFGRGGGLTSNPTGFIGGGLTQRSGFVQLADALQTGDLAGSWWGMYGDGTMRTGSAVTLTPTGAPTNTVENGWPVRTYTAIQNDQEPANALFPVTDFTVLKYVRVANLGATAELMCFGTGVANVTASLPFEMTITTGALTSYVSNGGAFSATTQTAALVVGAWALMAFSYQRVGGAANNVGTQYVNGVQTGTSATMGATSAVNSKWSTNGVVGAGSLGMASATRGVVVTYKALSAADIARIFAAVGP